MSMKRTFVIAEAGVNHNGDLQRAKEMIWVAKEAGADAIKFQTFRAASLVTKQAAKAKYQQENDQRDQTQYEMLQELELTENEFIELAVVSKQAGIEFVSTAFDPGSLRFLLSACGMESIKIPSGEVTNPLLLTVAAQSNKKIWLSTGMCSLGDIEYALSLIAFVKQHPQRKPSVRALQAFWSQEQADYLRDQVTILHCVSQYPAPFEVINLNVLNTLKHSFQLPVGYSDHTLGISASVAAVALGATVVEKHFTLSKTLPGPDHAASLEANELKQMIDQIREVEMALGQSKKLPYQGELANRDVVRKSIVANTSIKKGEIYTENNITVKRPGNGISAQYYWDWIGTASNRDYETDELIER